MLVKKKKGLLGVLIVSIILLSESVFADERLFTYSYEPDVLPKSQLEFEQWITARLGKDTGDYARWDLREELEYGITDRLTTALYLNFTDVYFSPKDGVDEEEEDSFNFKGISSEWKYQLLNPYTDPIGIVLYGEISTDGGEELELEEKIIIGKYFNNKWALVMNATYEQEWEFEHGETEKEAALEFTTGVSYKITPQWAVGLELRNHREFEDGLDLSDQAHSAWFLGPNVHYGAPSWWATFTVLPQIHGNGEGASGSRQLDEHERVELRLIAGVLF